MAVNKRQLVMDAIVAALAGIRKTDGYETDAGLHVYPWRTAVVPERDLPALIVRDLDAPTGLTVGLHVHEMRVEIEGQVKEEHGLAVDVAARRLIADVVKRIGIDPTFSALAEDTQEQTETMLAEQESKKLIGVSLTFTVLFTTERFNPYV